MHRACEQKYCLINKGICPRAWKNSFYGQCDPTVPIEEVPYFLSFPLCLLGFVQVEWSKTQDLSASVLKSFQTQALVALVEYTCNKFRTLDIIELQITLMLTCQPFWKIKPLWKQMIRIKIPQHSDNGTFVQYHVTAQIPLRWRCWCLICEYVCFCNISHIHQPIHTILIAVTWTYTQPPIKNTHTAKLL